MNVRLIDALLWLWLPLSCGIIKGLDWTLVGGITVYHLFPLAIYFISFFWAVKKNELTKIDYYFLLFLAYVVISGILIIGVDAGLMVRVAALVGVYFFAKMVTRTLTFDQIFGIMHRSALFFMYFSLLFSIIFHKYSVDTLQGREVLSAFYAQKNTFGRFVSVAMMLFLSRILLYKKGVKGGVVDLVAIIVSSYLLIEADSRTSLGAAGLFAATIFLLKLLDRLNMERLVVRLSPVLLIVVSAIIVLLIDLEQIDLKGVGSISDSMNVAGFEFALTGRATVWSAVFDALSSKHSWAFGFGYGGFFGGGEGDAFVQNIGLGVWVPDDAHDGYVDVLANLGLFGLLLVALLNLVVCRRLSRLTGRARMFWLSFIIVYLIVNITQSYFIKVSNVFPFMFYLLYTQVHAGSAEFKAAMNRNIQHGATHIGINSLNYNSLHAVR